MNPNDVNLSHVYTNGKEKDEFNITDLDPFELSEIVNNMCDRSANIVELILPYYESTSLRELDSRSLYFALKSVVIELKTVQKTVEAYALANKPTNSQA